MRLPDDLLTAAMRAYGRALAVADPIRIRLWEERGLTMPQLRLMFFLREEEPATAGELAAHLRVTPPTITGLTDRLVRQGLVARSEDPADRRVVRASLTDAGRAVIEEIDVAARAHMREVFDRMSDEQVRAFIEALEAFAEAAEDVEWREEAPAP